MSENDFFEDLYDADGDNTKEGETEVEIEIKNDDKLISVTEPLSITINVDIEVKTDNEKEVDDTDQQAIEIEKLNIYGNIEDYGDDAETEIEEVNTVDGFGKEDEKTITTSAEPNQEEQKLQNNEKDNYSIKEEPKENLIVEEPLLKKEDSLPEEENDFEESDQQETKDEKYSIIELETLPENLQLSDNKVEESLSMDKTSEINKIDNNFITDQSVSNTFSKNFLTDDSYEEELNLMLNDPFADEIKNNEMRFSKKETPKKKKIFRLPGQTTAEIMDSSTEQIMEESLADKKDKEGSGEEDEEEEEEDEKKRMFLMGDDKLQSSFHTLPLRPSVTLDEMIPAPSRETLFECLTEENKLTVTGAENFLKMPQPPDEVDILNESDVIEPNLEVNCPLPKARHYEDDEEEEGSRGLLGIPLSLVKCFGQEKNLPVLSMSQGQELSILYACSHCGVIYDVENKQQYLLQGHNNSISCLAASADKKFAIVGDKGYNSIVNIWQVMLDSKQLKPVKTFFNFQQYGVSAVAMSNTGNYLAIVSANPEQTLSIWNWTDPSETPILEIAISPDHGYQKDVIFNPEDSSQLVSSSESQVVFYAWNDIMIKSYSHPLTINDYNKIGKFTATVFFKNASSALSATNTGKFVVWERFKTHLLDGITPFKKIHKIVRMQNKPITVLTTVNKMIVTGDVIGQIKFYDETLKLVNWFQDVNLGSITSISFDFCPDFFKTNQDDVALLETAMKRNVFSTPNFIFGTSMARFVYVTANGTKYDIVSDNFDCPVVAIDIHPFKPLIAIGGQNGFLRLLHYKNGDSVASKLFENGKFAITCLKYNSDGSILAVGLSNGRIEILHGLNLRHFCKTFLNDTTEAITHISFSHNTQYMATADAGYAVTMYSIIKEKIWIDENQNFKFVGRYKAHNKPIRSILFRTNVEENSIKFFSLSIDRYLVEYEIKRGGVGLLLKSRDRVEQFGLPLCMASYPRLSHDDFIIICNDQFKFKLLNSISRICRKTLLGPKFGAPVEKFVISSSKIGTSNNTTHFVACMLDNKIAISLLPITGNQHRSFGMISHPSGVKNIVVSSDGKYMFSVGGAFASLMMWSINLAALEVQERLGGTDLAPFYEQIEEGKNSRFMYHLENLFYFAAIRNQGIHTRDKRKVGTEVPLAEIPSIMRALGYYPTEQEVFTMINEVRFENFAETGQKIASINVGDFLKLYINHRPVRCIQDQQIEWAFKVLGKKSEDGTYVIDEEELVNQLLNSGEAMTESELADCLATFADSKTNDICEKQIGTEPSTLFFTKKLNPDKFRSLLGFKKKD